MSIFCNASKRAEKRISFLYSFEFFFHCLITRIEKNLRINFLQQALLTNNRFDNHVRLVQLDN